jgi:hypothetical protein
MASKASKPGVKAAPQAIMGNGGGCVRYADGEIPMRGDRVQNGSGRFGTVLEVHPDSNKATIKWDQGAVGITSTIDNHLRLISRIPTSISLVYTPNPSSSTE